MTNSRFRKCTLYIGVILFFFSVNGFTQILPDKENDTIIVWTKGRKLNWNDFQIVKKNRDTINRISRVAESEIAIDLISVPINSYDYKYVIFPYFYKKYSTTNTTDEFVLNHEQLHFDIAELFARKMRQKIKQLSKKEFDVDLYNSEIDALYEHYFSYQESYDKETEHSIKIDKQQEWNKKITKELDGLSNYKSEIFK